MPFLSDTFTDTNGTLLKNHSPDVGGAWEELGIGYYGVAPSGTPVSCGVSGGQLVLSADNSVEALFCRNAANPAGTDYDIEFKWRRTSSLQTNRLAAVGFRIGAGLEPDLYMVQLNADVGRMRLSRRISGVYTELDVDDTTTIFGDEWAFRIEVRDASKKLFGSQGGGAEVELLSSTDNAITGAGNVGVVINRGENTNHYIDDLVATDVTSSLATPTGWTFTKTADVAEVTGSWDSVTDAASYDYEVEEWDGSAWQPFDSGATTDPTTTFTLDDTDGVQFSTLYRARVRAVPAV